MIVCHERGCKESDMVCYVVYVFYVIILHLTYNSLYYVHGKIECGAKQIKNI